MSEQDPEVPLSFSKNQPNFLKSKISGVMSVVVKQTGID